LPDDGAEPLKSVYTERDRGFAAFTKEWSKQNKLKSFIQNATAEHDINLFYLNQHRKPRSINPPLHP